MMILTTEQVMGRWENNMANPDYIAGIPERTKADGIILFIILAINIIGFIWVVFFHGEPNKTTDQPATYQQEYPDYVPDYPPDY